MRVAGLGTRRRKDSVRARDRHSTAVFAVEQAWRTLENTSRSIDRADAKAGAVLATTSVVAAALYNLAGSRASRGAGEIAALIAGGVLTLLAAVFSAMTLHPRRNRRSPPTNLVYFDHVARLPTASKNQYLARAELMFLDPDTLRRDLAAQVWETGRVAAVKYAWVGRAMLCLMAALAATGIAALIAAA